jgi:proteasome alpha subunit
MDMSIDMQHQAMGYDRAATMFSPEGHMLQVEYAEKTVRLGSATMGMTCADGVLLVADRRVTDKLVTPKSSYKISEIDDHIISSAAGILSDARILIEKAQLAAQQHRLVYDTPVEPELIIKEVANTKQMFTQYGGVRPFGVSVMIAGISNSTKKPELFTSDVTGNYFSYVSTAIGEYDEKVKEKLREEYKTGMNIDDGIKLCFKIFKEILGKNFDISRFDVAIVKSDKMKVERLGPDSLKKFVK